MEEEWQTCTDLDAMLEELKDASPRKLRLFAVASCRRISPLMPAEIWPRLVTLAERCAEGEISEAELSRARRSSRIPRSDDASNALINLTSSSAWGAASATAWSAASAVAWEKTETNAIEEMLAESAAQCDLLREIFGNPYRSLVARPQAIAPLAGEIYSGKWELMPLLGEWLQEHGFWEIGEHCLDPNVKHFKGCWVVDWVLGQV